jgi:hypothetical protein
MVPNLERTPVSINHVNNVHQHIMPYHYIPLRTPIVAFMEVKLCPAHKQPAVAQKDCHTALSPHTSDNTLHHFLVLPRPILSNQAPHGYSPGAILGVRACPAPTPNRNPGIFSKLQVTQQQHNGEKIGDCSMIGNCKAYICSQKSSQMDQY